MCTLRLLECGVENYIITMEIEEGGRTDTKNLSRTFIQAPNSFYLSILILKKLIVFNYVAHWQLLMCVPHTTMSICQIVAPSLLFQAN